MRGPIYPSEEAKGIWVYLEQEGGRFEGVSLELLGRARELADAKGIAVTGLLLGHNVGRLAQEAIACGADEVLVAEHAGLAVFTTDPYTKVVNQLVLEGKPDILLLGATANGRDLAGRLGVRLYTGLTADCVDLTWQEETGLLVGENTGFGGGIMAAITCPQHRPQMATVRPGIFATPLRDLGRSGRVRLVAVALADSDFRVQVAERVTTQGADITSAEVVVAGGRGTHGDFALLWELAGLLGGEVGATRVAVDEGWIDRERQIGQTGYVTRPKLAIVCGASGATQFTVGIEKAETVVAIDLDQEAPIFEQADYCIADDMFQVLPPFIDALKKAKTGDGGG